MGYKGWGQLGYKLPVDMTWSNGKPSRGVRRMLKSTAALAIFATLASFQPALAAQADKPKPSKILPERKPPVPAARSAVAPSEGAVIPAMTVTAPAASPLTAREKNALNEAVKAAAKRQWGKARAAVAGTRNPLLAKIIDWAYLREPGEHASFSERTAFVTANPTWPANANIIRRAEEAIDGGDSLAALSAWFAAHPPVSTAGKIAYARALRASGNVEQSTALVREAWTTGNINREDESSFLREFRTMLTLADYWARADWLLYDEQTTAATRLMPMLDRGQQAVVKARIALITSQKGMDGLISAVPAELQNDAGLLYDRIKWRRARNDDAGARELLPAFSAGGPRPDLWWRQRHSLARKALAEGNVTEAYGIAKYHGSIDALSISEAEWLAGWIALRFLKDGEAALQHFEKVYDSVETPPSLARGAYWMGRTMEQLGRLDLAVDWYQRGATYVTTYYGQLALARMRGNDLPQATLPADPVPTEQERAAFNTNELTLALRALMDVDARGYQRSFAQALAENSSSGADRHMAAELMSQLKRVDLGVVIARAAAREKITLLQYGYPAPSWSYPGSPEKALILAITRQESNFDVGARSGVGARGLMQLMPPTARAVARANKVAYAEKRLTEDPSYNVRLGASYLSSLVQDFNGSYILAAAGYNAGPGRSRQWIRQFGDPRDPSVDAVDWVEQIPFSETRTYVQRVMENLMIYRALLDGGGMMPRNLEAELARHD